MAEADISYGDYLAAVAKQRERDRDRYYGHDSHPEDSAFDASNGKRVGKRATLHIEIDDTGEPHLVEYRASGEEIDKLRRAASYMSSWTFFYKSYPDARAYIREQEAAYKARILEREQQAAAYLMDNPFSCESCSYRFKTERGQKTHATRTHKPRTGDYSWLIPQDPA